MTALAVIVPGSVSAQTGFHVTGVVTATEQERQEGYINLGAELMLATHPKSPIYDDLVGFIGHNVRVSVIPV